MRELCTREGCVGARESGPHAMAIIKCPLVPEDKVFAIAKGTIHYTGPVECPFMEQAIVR